MSAMLLQRSAMGGVAAGVRCSSQQQQQNRTVSCSSAPVPTARLAGSALRLQHRLVASRAVAARRASMVVRADAGFNPPPVSDTKAAFLQQYPRPLPGIYDTVIQELLVQQHLLRYQKKYQYDAVGALGFVSVFDQIMEGLPADEQEAILGAFLGALKEDPQQYRADAKALEEWARSASVEELKPDGSGGEGQKALAAISERAAAKQLLYSKFQAIGLFRLLELVGAKDPKALEGLVKSIGLRTELVNRDLLTYKGVLSKLSAAKELMKEIIARERKKASAREQEKLKLTSEKVDNTATKVEEAVEA